LKNWDIDFAAELYKKGMTPKSIEILIEQNIRRSIVCQLTDEDFNEIGIKTLGDKLILKKLMSDLN